MLLPLAQPAAADRQASMFALGVGAGAGSGAGVGVGSGTHSDCEVGACAWGAVCTGVCVAGACDDGALLLASLELLAGRLLWLWLVLRLLLAGTLLAATLTLSLSACDKLLAAVLSPGPVAPAEVHATSRDDAKSIDTETPTKNSDFFRFMVKTLLYGIIIAHRENEHKAVYFFTSSYWDEVENRTSSH